MSLAEMYVLFLYDISLQIEVETLNIKKNNSPIGKEMFKIVYSGQTPTAVATNQRFATLEDGLKTSKGDDKAKSGPVSTVVYPTATTVTPATSTTVDPPHTCDVTSICGSGKNLFPIMDPRFNLREAAKNLLLLEDHLFNQGKTCQDCCLKHGLLIEAFLEEAVSLDKENKYFDIIDGSLKGFRVILKEFCDKIAAGPLAREDCCDIAQRLRVIRKPLCLQFTGFIVAK